MAQGLVVDGGVDEVGVDVATLAVQVNAVVADVVVVALACAVPVDELDVCVLVAELCDQGVVRLAPGPRRAAVDDL